MAVVVLVHEWDTNIKVMLIFVNKKIKKERNKETKKEEREENGKAHLKGPVTG